MSFSFVSFFVSTHWLMIQCRCSGAEWRKYERRQASFALEETREKKFQRSTTQPEKKVWLTRQDAEAAAAAERKFHPAQHIVSKKIKVYPRVKKRGKISSSSNVVVVVIVFPLSTCDNREIMKKVSIFFPSAFPVVGRPPRPYTPAHYTLVHLLEKSILCWLVIYSTSIPEKKQYSKLSRHPATSSSMFSWSCVR